MKGRFRIKNHTTPPHYAFSYQHTRQNVSDYHPAKDIDERDVAAKDMADMFCGDFLGRGLSRWTYKHKHSKRYVVKFEPNPKPHFQNISEWLHWEEVKYSEMAQWFAPCYDISPRGHFLIQAHVKQCSEKFPNVELLKKYPKEIPAFFNDIKPGNFGFLPDGKFVCCDYSKFTLNILGRQLYKKSAMKRVDWSLFINDKK